MVPIENAQNAILLDDGLKLKLGKLTFHIDGKRLSSDSVNLISHAHSDHIPSRVPNQVPSRDNIENVVCSNITADLVNLRAKTKIKPFEDQNVKLLDSGHILG
ncbi:MAG: hypothetical protein QXT63_06520 [Thermoplasmata archaeon]